MDNPIIYLLLLSVCISCNTSVQSNKINNTPQEKSIKWSPEQETPVVFVQIQPGAFKNELDALYIRQRVESKIEKRLENLKIGNWIAGDLGPGGANMLFEIQNIEEAKEIILKIINEEKLSKFTVIGLRIYISHTDWKYKVIYPENYNGIINDM